MVKADWSYYYKCSGLIHRGYVWTVALKALCKGFPSVNRSIFMQIGFWGRSKAHKWILPIKLWCEYSSASIWRLVSDDWEAVHIGLLARNGLHKGSGKDREKKLLNILIRYSFLERVFNDIDLYIYFIHKFGNWEKNDI